MVEGQTPTVDLATSTVWIEDGLLRLAVKPHTTFTLEQSTRVVAAFRDLSANRPRPLIIDVQGYANADASSRKFSASPEVRSTITSMAIIVHSPVMRVIGTFFIRIARPPFPCKLFPTLDAAIAWTRSLGDR